MTANATPAGDSRDDSPQPQYSNVIRIDRLYAENEALRAVLEAAEAALRSGGRRWQGLAAAVAAIRQAEAER